MKFQRRYGELMGLANNAKNRGLVSEAEKWYKLAFDEEKPKFYHIPLIVGDMMLKHNKLDEAEHWYRTAYNIAPNQTARIRIGLGEVAFRKNKLIEADQWFKEAVHRCPHSIDARKCMEKVAQRLSEGDSGNIALAQRAHDDETEIQSPCLPSIG